jgi:hypothetical protein
VATSVLAFVLSTAIALAGIGGIIWYGRTRRVVGQPLSWGEAMVSATLVFALMFWCYGVVPHQWLTWAGNELSWRPDKVLVGPKLPFSGDEGLFEYVLPFSVNYETLNHIVAVLIYGVFLVLHVAMWAIWQDRAKTRPAAIATSEYGRPLVKQG